jgi:long-chain acyl-CoA synthetase
VAVEQDNKPAKYNKLRQTALYYGGGRIAYSDQTVLDLFAQTIETAPYQPALSFNDVNLNYQDLEISAKKLAAWMIRDAHIKSGDRVAIYLPNSLSYGIVVYAAWLAGAVVVNIQLSAQSEHVLHQLKDSSAKLLVTAPSLLTNMQSLLLQTGVRSIVTTRRHDYSDVKSILQNSILTRRLLKFINKKESLLTCVPLRDILAKRSDPIEWPVVLSSDIAVMQYTSRTSEPLGALLTHGSLIASTSQGLQALGSAIKTGCKVLCPIPLQHIIGIANFLMCVRMQGCFALTSINKLLENPQVIEQQFDMMLGVSSLYEQLLRESINFNSSSNLPLFLCGGSPISPSLHREWYSRTKHSIIEGYGSSESSLLIAASPPQRVKIGTAGVIVSETEVRIISNQGVDLGFNQAGELWIRGPQLMLGYWQRAQETSHALTHDGWLRTGDIASVDEDGYLRILERKENVFWVDNQVIFPRDIENAACEHIDVIDCMVFQVELQRVGVAQRAIKLFIVVREGLTSDHVFAFLQNRLKTHQMPDIIECVDQMPHDYKRKGLRRLFHEPHSAQVSKSDGMQQV